jgi:hypothetical protein
MNTAGIFKKTGELTAFQYKPPGTAWKLRAGTEAQRTGFTAGKGELYLSGDIIAFEAPGADLEGQCSPPDFGLYLHQIGLPNAAGMIFGMAYRITGYRVFSTKIAGP